MALITFDLNGTLLDPGDQAHLLHEAIALSMAHTLAGQFRPFAELIEAVGGQIPHEQPLFEDVAAGLDRLPQLHSRPSNGDSAVRPYQTAAGRSRVDGCPG